MEISAEPETINYKKLKELSEKYGIQLWSFHLPFLPFDRIDLSKKELCEHTVAYFSQLIREASAVGIQKFIVHPSGEPIEESDREDRLECARESLRRLAEFAQGYNAVIAVEDLPRTCLGRDSDEILALVSAHPALRVCFDTNHLLRENPVYFVERAGSRIITTHVSDYDLIDERHWLPGEGNVDWNALITALKQVGYEGAWLYEVAFQCPDTIFRDRDLTCEDFAKNAKELFAHKKPTVLGVPKEIVRK